MLEQRGVPYRFTHDLAELIDALIDHSIEYLAGMNSAVELTPFAGGLRYHDLPTNATAEETFDRNAASQTVQTEVEWAIKIVDASKDA